MELFIREIWLTGNSKVRDFILMNLIIKFKVSGRITSFMVNVKFFLKTEINLGDNLKKVYWKVLESLHSLTEIKFLEIFKIMKFLIKNLALRMKIFMKEA